VCPQNIICLERSINHRVVRLQARTKFSPRYTPLRTHSRVHRFPFTHPYECHKRCSSRRFTTRPLGLPRCSQQRQQHQLFVNPPPRSTSPQISQRTAVLPAVVSVARNCSPSSVRNFDKVYPPSIPRRRPVPVETIFHCFQPLRCKRPRSFFVFNPGVAFTRVHI